MKKILSILLAFVMLFLMTALIHAEPVLPEQIEIEQGNEIVPFYDYTSSCTTALSISGGSASCKSYLNGKSTVTKIAIKMTLQKKALLWWSEVETWNETYNATLASLTKTKTVGSGTYRVKTVYTVYSGGASETITDYSGQKKI